MDLHLRLCADIIILHIKADKIKSAQSYQAVDDSGNPAHASEDGSHQIKVKKSNQSPVYRSEEHTSELQSQR